MKRRALLSSAAGLALAGCSDGTTPAGTSTRTPSGDATPTATRTPEPGARADGDLPSDCPVDTLAGFEPPREVTEERVVSLVEDYEPAYVLDDHVAVTDHDLHADLRDVERFYHGYAVGVLLSGGVNSVVGALSAGPVSDDRDAPSVAAVSDALLREVVERAAETGDVVTDGWTPVSTATSAVELEGVAVPESAREDLQSLPSDDDGWYVGVGDETVRVRLIEGPVVHVDYYHYARYYVDSRVVRRTRESGEDRPETPPSEGELLECR